NAQGETCRGTPTHRLLVPYGSHHSDEHRVGGHEQRTQPCRHFLHGHHIQAQVKAHIQKPIHGQSLPQSTLHRQRTPHHEVRNNQHHGGGHRETRNSNHKWLCR